MRKLIKSQDAEEELGKEHREPFGMMEMFYIIIAV